MRFTTWTIGPTLADCLRRILRPGLRTFECGSGLSTEIFLDAGCEHIALEDDPKYAFKHPCVVIAPLTGSPPWYAVQPRGPFDVVLIDGPSAAKGGRWGIMRVAASLIGSKTVVLLDDSQRSEIAALATALSKSFGLSVKEVHPNHALDYGRRVAILASQAERVARCEG